MLAYRVPNISKGIAANKIKPSEHCYMITHGLDPKSLRSLSDLSARSSGSVYFIDHQGESFCVHSLPISYTYNPPFLKVSEEKVDIETCCRSCKERISVQVQVQNPVSETETPKRKNKCSVCRNPSHTKRHCPLARKIA
jgi:hypothetical protein